MVEFVYLRGGGGVRLPAVTRYMPRKYVETFFKTGELLLTSFQRCRNLEDQAAQDRGEGVAAMTFTGPGAPATFLTVQQPGAVYMLCSSLYDDASKFTAKNDAAIHITDPLHFAEAVKPRVEAFGFCVGACDYSADLVAHHSNTALAANMGCPDSELLAHFNATVGPHQYNAYFRKRLHHAHEQEFRFLWFAKGKQKENLLLPFPEAREFCRPRYQAAAGSGSGAARPDN
jgi:hypothetical protein